jgi:hypothetical protein
MVPVASTFSFATMEALVLNPIGATWKTVADGLPSVDLRGIASKMLALRSKLRQTLSIGWRQR